MNTNPQSTALQRVRVAIRLLPSAFCLLLSAFCLPPSALAQVALDDPLAHEPTWTPSSVATVRTQVFAWLDERNADESQRRQVEALWPADESSAVTPSQMLERLVATAAMVEPQAKDLADLCSRSHEGVKTPEFAWLSGEHAPGFVADNLRLWFGVWLAQQRYYDEALEQIGDLKPDQVVDPAALLFYQSVCHHWMLHKTEGLQAITQLLERRDELPRRYQHLADLMQADLADLEDDSLDHISRRMNDVTRRLDFARAGKRVREIEDGIIESLDKLIKRLEDQANAANQCDGDGQGGQGAPRGIRSTAPASDSRLARGKGPGEVTSKRIGDKSGWGDLPPKEREEAMQQIGKEFPSHYRDIIEQYFRKLATENEEK